MIALLFFFVLAFTFAALTSFTVVNFALGMVLAFFLMAIIPQLPTVRPIAAIGTGGRLLQFGSNLLVFSWDFVKDLTLSNILIARDVWTPKDYYDPTLVYVPVEDLTNMEMTLLSSRITLTPGTLTADVTEDRRFLVVHVMYQQGKTHQEIADGLRAPIDLLRRNLA